MNEPDRRAFLLGAAVGPVSALALAGATNADEATDSLTEAARAMTEALLARQGKVIDEATVRLIQQKIRGQLTSGQALKRVDIRNADEPDFLFIAEIP